MRRLVLFVVVVQSLAAQAGVARAEPLLHGIAMHGEPALPPGFSHFPYADPNAPKGGTITLGALGSFDSLNPLIVGREAASGIREFVYESLMARSLDEPFTLYGLIAETIEVPPDRSAITFYLNPKAHFSDGQRITPEDVLFSWELLKTKGRPNHRTYYEKVTKAERLDDLTVRFTFDAKGDREMPLIMGLMPVLPKHAVNAEHFEETDFTPPIGSGPYKVGRVEPGRSIAYVRDPEYWGRDLAVNRGRFNFAEIRFEYFRQAAALFESFKSGFIKLRSEDDPAHWYEDYNIPALADGRIVKAEFAIGVPAGMSALAFNTRRPVFADPRVRRALIRVFNFEWVNRNLYHDLYQRTESFFERSRLSSHGEPAGAKEQALLAPFLSDLKPEILNGTYAFPVGDASGHNRDNWKEAHRLLTEAGYETLNGRLVDLKTGKPLVFEILVTGQPQERLLGNFVADLGRLGIEARVRTVDSAQYQRRLESYDFDMIQTAWPASLSPGNEQLFRWSSEAANRDGTLNYPGVTSPAVDQMIREMLAATTREDFTAAVRALDRVLLSGDYVIPLFFLPRQWVAYWHDLDHPKEVPLFGFNLDTWWHRDGPS